MSLRTLKNQMKEPIYKDDLKRVILNGLIYMLMFSVLAGALQFFTETFLRISFGIFVLILAYMIGKRISEVFSSYHILYSLLAALFFILGYFIYRFTILIFINHNFAIVFKTVFSGTGFFRYILTFLHPANYFSALSIVNNVIDILLFAGSLILSYMLPRRRYF